MHPAEPTGPGEAHGPGGAHGTRRSPRDPAKPTGPGAAHGPGEAHGAHGTRRNLADYDYGRRRLMKTVVKMTMVITSAVTNPAMRNFAQLE